MGRLPLLDNPFTLSNEPPEDHQANKQQSVQHEEVSQPLRPSRQDTDTHKTQVDTCQDCADSAHQLGSLEPTISFLGHKLSTRSMVRQQAKEEKQ
jgi:hypothetical protein